LRRQPGFALLAIGILALGVGANTAIFSVLYGSLLRPLPFPEADRIVWMSDGHGNFGGAGANQSVPNLVDLQASTRLLESLTIYKIRSGNLSTASEPERVSIMYASSELFRTLGLPLQLGRDFTPDDDLRSAEAVAVLTDETWRIRFGADPAIVGKVTQLDARTVLIVGVADPRFQFPEKPQIIMALQHVGSDERRGNRGHYALGRMAPGAQLDTVRAELQGIYASLVEQYPEANEGWHTWAEPLRDYVVGRNARSLQLMAGAALLILLIACVNVANLMLVRAETRQREFAVRYSLGATRRGLVPLFLSEGIVLAAAGGALGIVAAHWGVGLLIGLYGDSLARADEVAVNGPALAFAATIALLVGVLVGFVPLLRSRAGATHETLKDGGRGASAGVGGLGRFLVGIEVALAVLIVVGAALLTNSLWRLQAVDLGLVDEEQVLTFRVSLPNATYHEADPVDAFYAELLANINRVPGVQAAGIVNRLPLLGGDNMSLTAYDDPTSEVDFASYRMVTEGYFEATGLRLLAGRWLNADDFEGATASIVINERLARGLFPDSDPVGQRMIDPMLRPGAAGQFVEGLEVVGVTADVVGGRAAEPAPAAFYFSFARALADARRYPQMLANQSIGMSVLVRTAGDPLALAEPMRMALREIDPEVPLFEVRTLEQLALDRLGTRRFAMSLFAVFAGLALLLGAVGIYGVMSFGVAQRSRELGVRMALGANSRSVLRLVLGEGMALAVPGVVVGLAAALAASRLLTSLLYEVSAVDPVTYVAVAGILGIVCLAAAYVPALRATRVDPLTSIRGD
jgi:predicted permease